MAILIINNEDYSNKLKNFSFNCKECNSNNIELEVDWGCYPSDSWIGITTICKNCFNEEILLDI
jgi:hypothetical protein